MEEIRKLLDQNRSGLVTGIDVEHGLLNDLISGEVLLEEHLETIKTFPTRREKNEKLLDILKMRDQSNVITFIEILGSKQKHLADLLKNSGNGSVSSKRKMWGNREKGQGIYDETQCQNLTLLENMNLKLTLEIKECQKKLEETKKALKAKEDQNIELNSKLKRKSDLEERFNIMSLELIDVKKQCQMLTENLSRSEAEVEKFKQELKVKTIKSCELENMLERKNEEKIKLISKIVEIEEKYPKFVNEIKQTGKNIHVRGSGLIMGVAMLNKRIYIVCLRMRKLFVFSDMPPYEQIFSEEFEISGLINPRDIVCSERDKMLFISDDDEGENEHQIWQLSLVSGNPTLERAQSCFSGGTKEIFRQQSLDVLSDGKDLYKVIKTPVDRKPGKMFVCTSEDRQAGTVLAVLTYCREEYFVYIYKVSDMKKVFKKVFLNSDLGEIIHVIIQPAILKNSKSQNNENVFEFPPSDDILSKTNFIVSHKSTANSQNGEIKTVWLISKLSCDGSTVLISFSPPVVDGVNINRPEYVTLTEACKVLVADQENDRLVILGPKFSGSQVLIKNDNKCSCSRPARVVCNLAKRIIVVSHWDQKGLFSVFTY